VRLQNDKNKRWDDTGTILVIRDSGRSYLVERDISGDSVIRNNVFLKRLAPQPQPLDVLSKGSQISPPAPLPMLTLPLPMEAKADPEKQSIRASTRPKRRPVRFEP
jgi:hypothetical protein